MMGQQRGNKRWSSLKKYIFPLGLTLTHEHFHKLHSLTIKLTTILLTWTNMSESAQNFADPW